MAYPEPPDIRRFLQSQFCTDATNVQIIGKGMFSQAYAFDANEQPFVIRLNAFAEDFQKDAFAHQHFASPALSIPKVVQMGRFDATHHYAITERCAGVTLNRLDVVAEQRIVPSLFATLDALHAIDVSSFSGWGLTDAQFQGRFVSWPDALLSLYNQKFDVDWRTLAQHTFFEREVFETLYAEMQRRLVYCPKEKWLVHGDFGFDNVMADSEQLTGVLDWAEARLGDFLYDVAYLDFWSQTVRYGDLWYARAQTQGRATPYFAERMRCYMLSIGLHSLVIAAALDDERDYIRVRERTQSVFLPERRAATDWTHAQRL